MENFKTEVSGSGSGSGSGLKKCLDPDQNPVGPESLDLDTDPVNIRPDPKP